MITEHIKVLCVLIADILNSCYEQPFTLLSGKKIVIWNGGEGK